MAEFSLADLDDDEEEVVEGGFSLADLDNEVEEPVVSGFSLADLDDEADPSPATPSSQNVSPSLSGLASGLWEAFRPGAELDQISSGFEALERAEQTGRPVTEFLKDRWSPEEKASLLGYGLPAAATLATLPASLPAATASLAANVGRGMAHSLATGALTRGAIRGAETGSLGEAAKFAANPWGILFDAALGPFGNYKKLGSAVARRSPQAIQSGASSAGDLLRSARTAVGERASAAGQRLVDTRAGQALKGAAYRALDVPTNAVVDGTAGTLDDLSVEGLVGPALRSTLSTLDDTPLSPIAQLQKRIADLRLEKTAAGDAATEARELLKSSDEALVPSGMSGVMDADDLRAVVEARRRGAVDQLENIKSQISAAEDQLSSLRKKGTPKPVEIADDMPVWKQGLARARATGGALLPKWFWSPGRKLMKSVEGLGDQANNLRRAIGARVLLGEAFRDAFRARGRAQASQILGRFDPADMKPRITDPKLVVDGVVPEELAAQGITAEDTTARVLRRILGEDDVALAGGGEQALVDLEKLIERLGLTKREAGVRVTYGRKDIKKLLKEGKTLGSLTKEETQQLLDFSGGFGTKTGRKLLERIGASFPENADGTLNTQLIQLPLELQENYLKRIVRRGKTVESVEPEAVSLREGKAATYGEAGRQAAGARRGKIAERPRSDDVPDEMFVQDLEEIMSNMIDSDSTLAARALAWGGKSVARDFGDGALEMGHMAARSLDELADMGEIPVRETAMLKNMLRDVYKGGRSLDEEAARTATQLVSNALLTRSFATSFSEMGKGIWASGGMKNWLRGKAIVKENPVLATFFDDTGAASAPVAELLDDVVRQGAGQDHWLMPREMMRKTERWLRGPVSHGAVATIDDVARRSSAAVRSGEIPLRIQKEATEILPYLEGREAVEYLAKQFDDTGGQFTADFWREGIYNLTRRWFYSSATGALPPGFATSGGLLLTQYRPFIVKAAQHAKDDILDLMFSKDPGLRQLGRKRFVQSAAYTIPPTAAANMLKLAMRGQSADPEDFQKSLLYAWVSNVYGIGGDVGAAIGTQLLLGDPSKMRDIGQIPVLSATQDIAEDVTSFDAASTVRGAGALAGAFDPRVKLFTDFGSGLLRDED